MIPSWSGEKHHDPAQELGSKIPGWLQREPIYDSYDGIEIKLPPQRHTSIIGFVVCVIIQGKYLMNFPDEEDEAVSMVYIPESVFWEQMNDDFGKGDWSLLVESDRSVGIIVRSSSGNIVKRCGAYIVYQKDRESIQQIENGISESDHGNSEFSRSAKSHLYYTFRIC